MVRDDASHGAGTPKEDGLRIAIFELYEKRGQGAEWVI